MNYKSSCIVYNTELIHETTWTSQIPIQIIQRAECSIGYGNAYLGNCLSFVNEGSSA